MAANPAPGAGTKPESTSGSTPSFESLRIKNSNINTAPGVQLSDRQKVVVGSVLDVCFPTTLPHPHCLISSY